MTSERGQNKGSEGEKNYTKATNGIKGKKRLGGEEERGKYGTWEAVREEGGKKGRKTGSFTDCHKAAVFLPSLTS